MAYNECSITVDWTLPIITKLGNFICEFDCKINFACWEDDWDEWAWEARTIEITECSFHPRHTFNKHTDPFMWEVCMRGIKQDFAKLDERIVERVREAA
jgi:hypothetical protein